MKKNLSVSQSSGLDYQRREEKSSATQLGVLSARMPSAGK